jgi:hypothetical protein
MAGTGRHRLQTGRSRTRADVPFVFSEETAMEGSCRRRIVSAVIVVLALAAQALAQTQTSARQVQEYVFPSDAGILFFHVRPDRVDDFEAVVKRLADALDRSTDPIRRQQAASWRIYRSIEEARDAVIYVFFFDPAVSDADYDPIKILSEDAPAELGALFERLRLDIVKVERMGLTKLR